MAKKTKILITGANGLLGQKILTTLQNPIFSNLFEPIATARGEKRMQDSTPYYSLDIADDLALKSVIMESKPDIIIHTAAMTQVDQCELSPEECYKQNTQVVQNLHNLCKQNNIFLIHLSTDFIFDGEKGPYSEKDTPNPLSIYGDSKWKAEQILLNDTQFTQYAIIRTVLVYGVVADMSRSNIVLWVKNSLEQNKNIQVVDDQWRTPTLAEDLAMGCLLVAQKKATGIFHIAGSETLTPYQIAQKVALFFQLDTAYISRTDASQFSQPAKRPPKTGFNIEKAKKELGYSPTPFEEGLQVVAQQLKKQTIRL
ncbi:MAG: SDR family oxidoreductase [Cytophagales bacterium]|nr:MAG: SDR family oxidoreductase [Cytophagales bacterium]